MINEGEEEEDTIATRFAEYMIYHFLKGVTAKNKIVRMRCCQFLSSIINTLEEISDDLYNVIKSNLCNRLYDKEPSVRLYAAYSLTRLQDNPEESENGPGSEVSITNILLKVLENDPSAEVRRAILLNLDKNKKTTKYLIKRALDVNPINRKYVYSKVVKEIGDFRKLSIQMRERLLQWGLQDRDEKVKQAATKMLLTQWIENVDGNLSELLERIDVVNSPDIAKSVLDVFFSNRKDAISDINFDDEYWMNLTPELVFLAKSLNEFCVKEKMNNILEQKMPELTKLSFILEHHQHILEEDPTNIDLQFIVEQLLAIAETYDYADEVGRRKMLTILRNLVTSQVVLIDEIIFKAVNIIRKISVNENDFSQVVVELISDIKDELEENMEKLKESGLSEEEYQSHIDKLQNDRLGRCLVITQGTLELITLPLESNTYIESLLDTLIGPSIRSHFTEIRERGLKCLGLCCLIGRKLARRSILLFGQCFTKGDETLKALSIKILTDLFMVHGCDILNDVPEDDEEEIVIDLKSIHKLYYRAIQNDDLEVQSTAAISLCKLLLNGIFDEPDLLKALVVQYFSYFTSENETLRQALSYCIPVYCYSSPDRQRIMALIAVDSLTRLSGVYESAIENEESMLNPTQIFQQIIDWTDPARVVVLDADGQKLVNNGGYADVQCDLAFDMLRQIENALVKDEKKTLCLSLNKLKIGPNINVEKLRALKEEVEHVIAANLVTESLLKNAINKFLKTLIVTISQAVQNTGNAVEEESENITVTVPENIADEEKKEEEEDSEEDNDDTGTEGEEPFDNETTER